VGVGGQAELEVGVDSVSGAPELVPPNCAGFRVAVVAPRWHERITDALLDGALRALKDAKVSEPAVFRVPGSFELPSPPPSSPRPATTQWSVSPDCVPPNSATDS
jgi:6,7-dimethyl-8-ribityllumazine synthase